MLCPIWALRVIGLLLKLSFKEWYFESIAKLIDCRGGVLMSRQDGVQFVEQTLGQLSTLRNTVDDEFDRRFLVAKDVDEPRRFDVGIRVRNEIFQEAIGDQCFRRSTI